MNKNLLPCGCEGHPRPALEHNKKCPLRLSFFGAPKEWGMGKYEERRLFNKQVFVYTEMSWIVDPNMTQQDILREERKEKIIKIDEKSKLHI